MSHALRCNDSVCVCVHVYMPVFSCNVCTCVSVSVVCVIAGSVLLSNSVGCGSCRVAVSSWCRVRGGAGVGIVCVCVFIVISVG